MSIETIRTQHDGDCLWFDADVPHICTCGFLHYWMPRFDECSDEIKEQLGLQMEAREQIAVYKRAHTLYDDGGTPPAGEGASMLLTGIAAQAIACGKTPPNDAAVEIAGRLVDLLAAFGAKPDRIVPGADGCVYLYAFTSPQHYSYAVVDNDGDVVIRTAERYSQFHARPGQSDDAPAATSRPPTAVKHTWQSAPINLAAWRVLLAEAEAAGEWVLAALHGWPNEAHLVTGLGVDRHDIDVVCKNGEDVDDAQSVAEFAAVLRIIKWRP